LCVEKDIVRYKKRILDLNKDKDNYGKNSRVDIPKKKKERCYSIWIRNRAIGFRKAQVSQDKKSSRLE
jgi:hypothetical protein